MKSKIISLTRAQQELLEPELDAIQKNGGAIIGQIFGSQMRVRVISDDAANACFEAIQMDNISLYGKRMPRQYRSCKDLERIAADTGCPIGGDK